LRSLSNQLHSKHLSPILSERTALLESGTNCKKVLHRARDSATNASILPYTTGLHSNVSINRYCQPSITSICISLLKRNHNDERTNYLGVEQEVGQDSKRKENIARDISLQLHSHPQIEMYPSHQRKEVQIGR
jgi:hypothetical protein